VNITQIYEIDRMLSLLGHLKAEKAFEAAEDQASLDSASYYFHIRRGVLLSTPGAVDWHSLCAFIARQSSCLQEKPN
jgi:hypothetical protein